MITVLPNTNARYQDASALNLPHILLVLDQFPKILGGGERIVFRIADLLPKYGYRVSILTFFVHPDCNGIKSASCPIYVLPLQRTYDWNALRCAFDFRRFLVSQQIQIVQTFFESSDLWAGFVTKMSSHAKLIWSRRDMGILRSRKHRIAYRLMAGLPDAVFSVSEQVRKYCIEKDHIDPNRVQTIYNGLNLVDQTTLERLDRSEGSFRVVTLGNIRRVKGHDILIKAAADILTRHPKVSFSIAGEVLEQDYFVELQTLVRNLNLVDRVSFVGEVKNTQEYLSNADIFVLPSRSEGFSNAIVEAMAASLPVIATDVGGNAEAVKDGVTGFIVPPDDFESVAAAVNCLLCDPLQAVEMGVAGRFRVAHMFTAEAMMGKITDTYEHLLA